MHLFPPVFPGRYPAHAPGSGMSKGERTRQAIIEASAPLFNQRGYEGCSMADIMQATGLEKGGLYRHFDSKEELAADVFRYSLARVIEARTFPPESATAGSLEQLRIMVARFVEVPSPVPGGCPLLNTAIEADDGNPLLRKLAREGLQRWKRKIAAAVRQGIRAGSIVPAASPDAVANHLIAALEGALMIARLEGNRRALKDAQAALDVYLSGLAADAASSHARATSTS